MFHSNLRHTVALLLLGAFLIASVASAGDLRGPTPRSMASESFQPDRLLFWVFESLATLWGKEGAEFDPFGLHATTIPPPIGAKEGGSFDPFGLHGTPPPPTTTTSIAPASGDAGAEFDPFG